MGNPIHNKQLTTFIIVAAVLLITLVCISPATAGLRVVGAKYMEDLAPGITAVHTMEIKTRTTDAPIDVLVEVMGFGQGMDRSYQPLPAAEDTSPYSARPFTTLSASEFHLNPGESKTVAATIQMPASGDGGRYALIYVHTKPQGEGQFGFVTAVTVPEMITIAGSNIVETGTITGVETGTPEPGQPIPLTTKFTNTGNHHYYNAKCDVVVFDTNGQPVAQLSIGPSQAAIIPGNEVGFTVNLGAQLPVGSYTVNSKVSVDGRVLDETTQPFTVEAAYVAPIVPTSAIISQSETTTIYSSDGRYSVTFPQGSVFSDINASMGPVNQGSLYGTPAGYTLAASSFKVSGIPGLLSNEATITVQLQPADLAAAGNNPNMLTLAVWDSSKKVWNVLPTGVDAGSGTLSAKSNLIGTTAVLSSGSPSSGGASTPLPAFLPVMALGAAMLLLVGLRRKN